MFCEGGDENGDFSFWQCGDITTYNSDSDNNICGGPGIPYMCTPS